MNGSKPDNSALAESIRQASSPPSSLTPATEKNPGASGSTPSNVSPLALHLRLPEILPHLKVEQGHSPDWFVLGGHGPADSLLAVEARDVSGVLWDASTNKIFLSSRSNGLISLDCSGLSHCPVASWQKRLVLALLGGLIDRLPFPFSLATNFPSST